MAAQRQRSSLAVTRQPILLAMAGAISLAGAMGIGRFALTPLIPSMTREGLVGIEQASWLATANYFGYLVGSCAIAIGPWLTRGFRIRKPFASSHVVRWSLLATSAATAATAVTQPDVWPLLRFACGLTGLFALIATTGWCFRQLAIMGRPELGGIIFTGPGLGICISGAAVGWAASFGLTSDKIWLLLALILTVMTAGIWPIFSTAEPAGSQEASVPKISNDIDTPPPIAFAELFWFIVAYGLAGLGYIVTATYLPVIAQAALGDQSPADYFWPIIGIAAVLGSLASLLLPSTHDFRIVLAICYTCQALGIAISVILPTTAGFGVSSFLVGFPFTAISLFAMREARRLRGNDAAALMGGLSASFGIGQLAGPVLVTELIRDSSDHLASLDHALAIAGTSLVAGVVIFLIATWIWPIRREATS